MIHEMHNQMRRMAAMVQSQMGQNRWGTVTSTRQTDTGYEAKVTLQPEAVTTEWLPILSPMVGSGWGLVCPPVPGMQAFVAPDCGDGQHGVILGLTYSTQAMPPQPGGTPVKAGQFALTHSNGSYLLFDDNDVTLHTNRDLIATVGRNLTATVTQNATVAVQGNVDITAQGTISATGAPEIILNAGTVQVNGDLKVSGNIYDLNAAHGNLALLRVDYNAHTHVFTDSHGDTGVTLLPNPQDP